MEVSCLSSGAGQKRGCPARPRAWTGRTTPSGPSMGCMASDGPPPAPIKASPRPPGPVPSNPPSRQLAGTADLTGPLCAGSRKSASLGFDAGRRRPQAKLGDGGGVPGIYMLWAPRRALPRAHPPPGRPGAAPNVAPTPRRAEPDPGLPETPEVCGKRSRLELQLEMGKEKERGGRRDDRMIRITSDDVGWGPLEPRARLVRGLGAGGCLPGDGAGA